MRTKKWIWIAVVLLISTTNVKAGTYPQGNEINLVRAESKVYSPQFQEEDPEIVLVSGNPPLKQKIINLYFKFFAYLTKTELTESQRKRLKEALIEEFRRATPEEKRELLLFEQRWQQIQSLPSDQKEVLRVQLVNALTQEAAKNPNNLSANLLVEILSRVNKILVPGNPPLTQQVVDAYIEMVGFILSLHYGKEFEVTSQMKRNAENNLINLFKDSTFEQKREMATWDLSWTGFKVLWAQANEAQKAEFIKELEESVRLKKPLPLDKLVTGKTLSRRGYVPQLVGYWVYDKSFIEIYDEINGHSSMVGDFTYQLEDQYIILIDKSGKKKPATYKFELTGSQLILTSISTGKSYVFVKSQPGIHHGYAEDTATPKKEKEEFKTEILLHGIYDFGTAYTPPGLFR